jgi:hypothetical protein
MLDLVSRKFTPKTKTNFTYAYWIKIETYFENMA